MTDPLKRPWDELGLPDLTKLKDPDQCPVYDDLFLDLLELICKKMTENNTDGDKFKIAKFVLDYFIKKKKQLKVWVLFSS